MVTFVYIHLFSTEEKAKSFAKENNTDYSIFYDFDELSKKLKKKYKVVVPEVIK